MAADILVYRATHVPVGEDQKQHLELTARHRAEVQQRLCRQSIARGTASANAFFPLPEPLIQGPATARHEPARRLEEDVEVRPVRLFAHQPDRRCRHHRAEDPQGEDRPRAAADRSRRPCQERPEAENLVGIYAGACRDDEGGGAAPSSAARSSPSSSRRWPTLAVAKLAPIAGEMQRLHGRPRLYRRGAGGRLRARPRHRRADMAAVKDIVGSSLQS